MGGGQLRDVGVTELYTATRPVGTRAEWTALESTRIAWLDAPFAAALRRWPELGVALLERSERRFSRLAVLQAMKMENELSLPRGGTVTSTHAEAGQTVEQGQVLLVIE